jgi:predicted restriction endonuclease
MCYKHTTKEKLKIAYAPLVTRAMKLQHVYKLCIVIDLLNDNQYWTILINNVIGMCSTNLVHKVHFIWSNKNTTPVMELQNFMYTTSCTYRAYMMVLNIFHPKNKQEKP